MKTVLESIALDYAFMFTFKKVNSIKLEGFKQFFDDMPIDPYIRGKYRSRRLSRFIINGNELVKLPHGYLFQSKEYNPVVGDIRREFAELDDRLIALDNFKQMIFAFFDVIEVIWAIGRSLNRFWILDCGFWIEGFKN